jgi:dTDP-4-amino-4,6-dideoxygalactose transaminase
MPLPFNKIYFDRRETLSISKACKNSFIGNYGPFTSFVEKNTSRLFNSNVLATHSCTAALEMSAILIDIKKGDEVIMPSYTFVSTANAFAIRGAKIVFADIDYENLNIDENKVSELITKKTKAIVVVHYAGVACKIDKILSIAKKNNLFLIEDAAQAFMSKYKGKYLGTFGDFGTFSFHETKNLICGQGGMLLVNKKSYLKRATYLRDKGTNRSEYNRKMIKNYTWVDLGSSYTMGELSASILKVQLKKKFEIFKKKRKIWMMYYNYLKPYNKYFDLPIRINKESNGHIFYLLLPNKVIRDNLKKKIAKYVFLATHYEPLHKSKAGKIYGKTKNKLRVTESISKRLIRLPTYLHLNEKQIKFICFKIVSILKKI